MIHTQNAQVITIASQKGGTGKTTTAAALTQAATAEGLRALAIDLDPQGNLSFIMGANANGLGGYALITGQATAASVIQRAQDGSSVITASRDYQALTTAPGSARRLEKALRPILANYDLIIIDTPPTGAELLLNGLMCSTGVIITLEASALGLQGLYQVCDTLQRIRPVNAALSYTGILYTRHSTRSTIARQMADAISTKAQALGLPTLGGIREAVAVKEAQALQTSLYSYAPDSKPAQDYKAVLTTILQADH